MKLGELVAKIMNKCGIDPINVAFKDVVSNTIEVDDVNANKMVSDLITISDAKNSGDLKKHFFALALNGADGEINRILQEMNIAVEDRADIDAEKSTMKKIDIMAKRLVALEQKKASETGKGKDELTKQINTLTDKIAKETEAHNKALAERDKMWEGKISESALNTYLSGKKYANDKLPINVNIVTARTILNEELAKIGAVLVHQNSNFVVKQLADPTLEYLASDNTKPTFDQITDKILSANSLLAVTGSNQGGGAGGNAGGNAGGGNNGKAPVIEGGASQNQNLLAATNDSLKDLGLS